MTGSSYRCIVEDADNAVLFVHGILGTPNHFGFLMPLVPENWSVVNICLDGHGGSATDFSSTSMEKWRNQVSEELRNFECRWDILSVPYEQGSGLLHKNRKNNRGMQ